MCMSRKVCFALDLYMFEHHDDSELSLPVILAPLLKGNLP